MQERVEAISYFLSDVKKLSILIIKDDYLCGIANR